MKRFEFDCLSLLLAAALPVSALGGGFDPLVPFAYQAVGVTNGIAELRRIRETTGMHRFLLCAPGFNEVMYRPFPADLYERIGRDVSAFRRGLADTDIEIGWWCSPSIRYVSDFPPIEDAEGNRSVDNKKCPLDPAFAADFTAKVCAVARHRPAFINIEDDFTLSWGRGLGDTGACFCPRHLDSFAARYGKVLSAQEIADAFRNQTPENLQIRRAFADTIRESLVVLARQVRAAVDRIDPSIRIMLCQPGGCDKDGDSAEALARAFAGGTRPCMRPFGAIYGAETIPAEIPGAVAHAVWTIERLPKDIETFYEADTYPHNRFYSSAAQLLSLMSGAISAGADDFLLYCLQYLDDPLEDRGYVDLYAKYRPRFERVRRFVRERGARLEGVRQMWTADDLALTRGFGSGHGTESLRWQSYLCAKYGLPYTTRPDATGPALLVAGVADVLADGEIRRILSGGVLVDAPAAAVLARRGFAAQLGVDVDEVAKLPATGERILPAAGCSRRGKGMNAFFLLSAGSEDTVEHFVRLRPRQGTEVLSEFTGLDGQAIAPSVTYAENALGGRVAVMATSLVRNRTSALYNLRKQELVQRLFARLNGGDLPVMAVGVPGIWLMANVAADGREMLLTVDNLSGDVREDVRFRLGAAWQGARVFAIAEDGSEIPLGEATDDWHSGRAFASMLPEYFLFRRKD